MVNAKSTGLNESLELESMMVEGETSMKQVTGQGSIPDVAERGSALAFRLCRSLPTFFLLFLIVTLYFSLALYLLSRSLSSSFFSTCLAPFEPRSTYRGSVCLVIDLGILVPHRQYPCVHAVAPHFDKDHFLYTINKLERVTYFYESRGRLRRRESWICKSSWPWRPLMTETI